MEFSRAYSILRRVVLLCSLFKRSSRRRLASDSRPNRDGRAAADEKLADSWPKDGPPVLWQREVGGGFSGLAIAGNTAVLFHRVDDEEVAEAIDTLTARRNGRTAVRPNSPAVSPTTKARAACR